LRGDCIDVRLISNCPLRQLTPGRGRLRPVVCATTLLPFGRWIPCHGWASWTGERTIISYRILPFTGGIRFHGVSECEISVMFNFVITVTVSNAMPCCLQNRSAISDIRERTLEVHAPELPLGVNNLLNHVGTNVWKNRGRFS
jgi:hypothetical protein